MDILDFYYQNIGEEPTDKHREITGKTFSYLKDNNFSDKDILKIFKKLPVKTDLSFDDLPDELWENSLIKRNTYYYHNELHIISPAPYWDVLTDKIVSPKFYLEMKIKYTINNLIDYFYKTFPKNMNLVDDKKDVGSMNYLLNKYRKITFIETIDFILYLIDEAKNDEYVCNDILDVQRYEEKTFKYLENKVNNAMVEKKNIIIWR
jgi:hypothetical protein